jgi:hypothetical protein
VRTAVHRAGDVDYPPVRVTANRPVTGTGLIGIVHRREPHDRWEGIVAHDRQYRACLLTSAAGKTSPLQTVAYRPRGSPSAAASTVTWCAIPVTSTSSAVAIVRRR